MRSTAVSSPSASIRRNLLLLAVFGVPMGLLEAIIVMYLRQLYCPQGFAFPLSTLPPRVLAAEWLREAATVIMLVAVGLIAGRSLLEAFSYFLYSFAIWDISYYAGLKWLVNWPPSLLTWDLLFLIPVPWIGPVLTPIACSLTMMLFAACLLWLRQRGYAVRIGPQEWGPILLGASLILGTLIPDFARMTFQRGLQLGFRSLAEDQTLQRMISAYRPTHYSWSVFALGEVLMLGALALVAKRARSASHLQSGTGDPNP